MSFSPFLHRNHNISLANLPPRPPPHTHLLSQLSTIRSNEDLSAIGKRKVIELIASFPDQPFKKISDSHLLYWPRWKYQKVTKIREEMLLFWTVHFFQNIESREHYEDLNKAVEIKGWDCRSLEVMISDIWWVKRMEKNN